MHVITVVFIGWACKGQARRVQSAYLPVPNSAHRERLSSQLRAQKHATQRLPFAVFSDARAATSHMNAKLDPSPSSSQLLGTEHTDASASASPVITKSTESKKDRAITKSNITEVILYVDPTHEQEYVEAAVKARGASVVLLSKTGLAGSEFGDGRIVEAVPAAGHESKWAHETLPPGTVVVGVFCGDDASLAHAERLATVLCPQRANGLNSARRDKYLMNEVLRRANVPVASQSAPASWSEARAFISTKCGYPVIIKPRRGVSSILVGLAHTEEEAASMYASLATSEIQTSPSEESPGFDDGEGQGGAVVQEYLLGEEWIVDTVSRDGEHKVVALWKYDKGLANGAPFVYFGVEAMPLEGAEVHALAAYALSALNALEWRWGPAHIELMLTADGPRLVEVNMGRWNGIRFKLVADRCIGYDAYELTASAYLDEEAWGAIPSLPPAKLLAAGCVVHLVSHADGTLRKVRHQRQLKRLASLVDFDPRPSRVGDKVSRTTDFTSCAGEAHLIHSDRVVLQRDYAKLRKLQPSLFAVERWWLRWPWSRSSTKVLYLRRGHVVQELKWVGSRRYAARQMVVDALEMDRGSMPIDGSMAGVKRVRLLSATGEKIVLDAKRLHAPDFEVVATVTDLS